jgi:hypothetical protein
MIPTKGKEPRMNQKFKILLLLAMAAMLSLGCAGWTFQKTNVKCPKCGATFTVEEEMLLRDFRR